MEGDPLTEPNDRVSYKESRVLIETQDVLESDFQSAVLHFTGGQLNVLRNVVAYATRLESFVSEYHSTYYVVPDDTEWVALSALVSELENILMGNDNVIFGYNERLWENLGATLSVTGTYQSATGAVPAGEVWNVQQVSIRNVTGNRGGTFCNLIIDSYSVPIAVLVTSVQSVPLEYNGLLTLKEGDRVEVAQVGAQSGDVIQAHVWGYKMKVPV